MRLRRQLLRPVLDRLLSGPAELSAHVQPGSRPARRDAGGVEKEQFLTDGFPLLELPQKYGGAPVIMWRHSCDVSLLTPPISGNKLLIISGIQEGFRCKFWILKKLFPDSRQQRSYGRLRGFPRAMEDAMR